MRISYNWLKEMVEISDPPEVLGRRLTGVGLAVDTIETVGDETFFEFDITTNRPDCLSHRGVAREVAALVDKPVRNPEFVVEESDPSTTDKIRISIADPDLCGRYAGRYIDGVRIGPSPEWLRRRLESLGARSINNVADVTNYVMLELGQPLHAFDAHTLGGQQIIVRRATDGEQIQTLDGTARMLTRDMLVIADAQVPAALAGIMGGAATEITNQTTAVLLESAWFAPPGIRKTARALNMSTEASYRYERGADIDLCAFACDRAASLIRQVAGGRILKGIIDVYPAGSPNLQVKLRRTRIGSFLGMPIPDADVIAILHRLGLKTDPTADGWVASVPPYRVDVTREEDLLEEVARHYGYDRFPATVPVWAGHGALLPTEQMERRVRALVGASGYSEINTLSLSNEPDEAPFRNGRETVTLTNPLSEEGSTLRTSLVPSALKVIQWNVNRGTRDLQLFEIGKVYSRTGEETQLLLAATGGMRLKSVHEAAQEFGFFDLKGDVERLLREFQLGDGVHNDRLPEYYHPTRAARVGNVAIFGELHPDVRDLWKLRTRVHIAEIRLSGLYQGRLGTSSASIPKFPAVRRDLSLLVDRGIEYQRLSNAIRNSGIAALVDVRPFDRLESGPFPDSKYSISIALTYQSSERTLTDDEVEGYDRAILKNLESETGARLRA